MAPFSSKDLQKACVVLDAYPDLSLGLADASMLVLANRCSESRILTLNQRQCF